MIPQKMLSQLIRKRFECSTSMNNNRWNYLRKLCSSYTQSSQLGDKIPKEKVDCVVIGAGVVGLAIVRELAIKGRDVLLIESASTFGTGTSSRNSEVIHAGIYYPRNSLKARFCVRGRKLLYEYCSSRGVPYKQIGKLIVATGVKEIPKLSSLLEIGTENGVEGLRMMEGVEAMKIEPELQCLKALLSPSSGIVDSHSLMLSLLGEAENHGATISYNTTVIGGSHVAGDGMHIHISESKNVEKCIEDCPPKPELTLIPNLVVNSSGLSAPSLAKMFCGLDSRVIPSSYYARGCYFSLSNTKSPFKHLIYPIPEDGGLGVHVTLDLAGNVKFGPDVEWIGGVDYVSSFLNKFDYSVCPDRMEKFYPEIRRYYPNLKDGSLEPGYAGIRPKLSGPGESPVDFVIQADDTHGVHGLVNLFGIESPGLTASLAIAEYIAFKLSG